MPDELKKDFAKTVRSGVLQIGKVHGLTAQHYEEKSDLITFVMFQTDGDGVRTFSVIVRELL